ncbi:MAG TPA: hypothetical protein V6D20_18785 [Candidatus Obscuribacterales bacterium]
MTIKTDELHSAAVGIPPVVKDSGGTEVGQFCRAWVNFNGTGTVAIRDSFNISSLTDNGTGDYTLNFSNAMANANYAAVAMHIAVSRGSTGVLEGARSVSSITLQTYNELTADTSTAVDPLTVSMSIFGD